MVFASLDVCSSYRWINIYSVSKESCLVSMQSNTSIAGWVTSCNMFCSFCSNLSRHNSWVHTCALVIVDHEELNGGWHVVHSQISQQNTKLRMWFFAIRFSLVVKKALSGCKVCTYWLHQMVWKLQWYPLEQSLATAKNLLSGIGRFNCCPSSTRRNLKPMSLR